MKQLTYEDFRAWNLAIISGFLPVMIYDLMLEKSWLVIAPIFMYFLMTYYLRRYFK